MDNITADNATLSAPEETSASIAEDTGVAAGDRTTEENNTAAEQENVNAQNGSNDVTRTQAFAQRLKERTNREIAAAGIVNPYTGDTIRNAADLRALRRMQDAEAAGRDPSSAAGEAELLDRLNEYELREQETAIMANPVLAPYYEEFRDEAQLICSMAHTEGRDIDLDLALRTVMAQHMEDIQKREAERVRQETIRHYNAQSNATPGSIGGSETPPPIDFTTMSKAEFEKWQQKALRGELKSGT